MPTVAVGKLQPRMGFPCANRDRSFEAFCQVLGIDPQDIVQSI